MLLNERNTEFLPDIVRGPLAKKMVSEIERAPTKEEMDHLKKMLAMRLPRARRQRQE